VSNLPCFTVEIGVPAGAPRKRRPYRGSAPPGRWGPQSGRPGHRPPGKIRYFRNDLCSFPGREAGSVSGAHNPIGEATSRMAAGTVIYVRSGEVVFQFCNTHEDLTSRTAAGTVIYGIFGGRRPKSTRNHAFSAPRPQPERENTSLPTPKVAKVTCFRPSGSGRTEKTRHFAPERWPK